MNFWLWHWTCICYIYGILAGFRCWWVITMVINPSYFLFFISVVMLGWLAPHSQYIGKSAWSVNISCLGGTCLGHIIYFPLLDLLFQDCQIMFSERISSVCLYHIFVLNHVRRTDSVQDHFLLKLSAPNVFCFVWLAMLKTLPWIFSAQPQSQQTHCSHLWGIFSLTSDAFVSF